MKTGRGSVLCIDSDANVTRALSWILRSRFNVVATSEVAEAIDLVRADDFDVIVCDRDMRNMSGVDFLNIARQVSPRSVRLLLSGLSDLDTVERAVNESEIYRYLKKPWVIGELQASIASAMAIARSAPGEHRLNTGPEGDRRGEILVMDDDADSRVRLEAACGDKANIRFAANLADAISLIDEHCPGVIVAETSIGNVDTTRLLRMLKQNRPEMVAVVVSSERNGEALADLVNQAQVYRFLRKPAAAAALAATLAAALRKHRCLQHVPNAVDRHLVDKVPPGMADAVLLDVENCASRDGRTRAGLSRVSTVRAGFHRIFHAGANPATGRRLHG